MRRAGGYVRVLGVGLLAALAHRAAHAEPAHDQAAALELFNRAKELQAAGDWAGACAKFEASMALNPAVGTQTRLARCDVNRGKLARAWSDYAAALSLNRSLSGQSVERTEELRRLIEKELAALAPRVPKLRVVIPDPPRDLKVFRDGVPFPEGALGEDLPVDPGKIEITVEAPGYIEVRREVMAVEGQVAVVEIIPKLAAIPSPLPRVASPAPGLDVATVTPVTSAKLGQQRVSAFVVGGAGVVGMGIAAGLGINALNKASEASPYCTPAESCKATGLELLAEARHAQTGAFVSLAIGTALAATGVVLWFTAPRGLAAGTPTVSVGPGVVTLRAVW